MSNANRIGTCLSSLAAAALAASIAYYLVNDTDSTGLHLKITKLRSVTTKASPTGIAWSPDGKKFAAIHDFGRIISVWSSSGDPIVSIKREVTTGPYVGSSLAFMPDSRTILAPAPTPNHKEYSSLGLWDAETGALQRVVPPPSSERIFQAVVARVFALSPDGSRVALRPIDSQQPISVYRTDDWSLIKTKQTWRSETVGLKPYVRSDVPGITPPYVFTPNNSRVSANALAFAPNNDLAIGLLDGLAIIESDPSSTSFRFFESEYLPVESLAYSPNGQFVAAGMRILSAGRPNEHSARLQIRDGASGNIVVEDNTIGEVDHLAWNRDGQILAALTAGNTIRLYRPFIHGSTHQDVTSSKGALTLAFSPTRSELAVSTETGVDFYSIK